MKHLFAWVLAAAMSMSMAAMAQVMPPPAPATLQGQPLKDWLRTNWYDGKRVDLGYNVARGKMYNYIDVYNGQLTCVYSGYSVPKTLDSAATGTTNVGRINCEHSIPQSWFDQVSRMRSDIHHLFPTYDTWNSNRGDDMLGDVPDTQTQIWMRGTVSQATIPTANIDEWSEDTPDVFEPREDHKGNVARCAFYFYTMHQGQTFDAGKEVITALGDLQTLYKWHLADPVDARERERNRRTAKSQGNFNPYIAYPELVARAYGLIVQPTFAFTNSTGTILEGNTGTSIYTTTVTVNPAPTSTITVQVAVDAANSTATNPADYSFSTQTLTFAAGETTKTISVTVNGDTQPEADEVVQLTLTNPSTGSSTGGAATQALVITNDDGEAPTVKFASMSGSLPEGNTGTQTYTVNVTFTGTPTTTAVTVPVTVVAASTTADAADYTLNTTSLTFAAGQTNQTRPVTITVNGDLIPEVGEVVYLRLGTPTSGAIVGTPGGHAFTISNDDQPPTAGNCSRLFFSEYVEASSGNTKVLEIFNPSPFAIDLAGKRVSLYTNGSTTPVVQQLTGSIAAGDVYIIANAGSVASVLADADLTSNVTFFNGDDAIALFDGTDTLDVIGVIGQQPAASGWVIPGGGTTTNNTLVRKNTVGQGDARWSRGAATWQAVGADVYTNIGSHSSSCLTLGTKAPAISTNKLEVYPTPATQQLHVRLPELAVRTEATISLFNALGQQVLTRRQVLGGASAEATLDVRSLPAGLYTVRVAVGNNFYTSRAIVQP
ncbi:endonuclease [Hymenobacter elongatus]|uniref:T9SS type A sorting domain-containing protein n=1 Tax=Hymenobacter elongatus TaxID=877208 RepID=A0A4Z0PG97_9BACT|nr:endonuclease [Hymenobacter elongatus]TGE14156.1 T9SS type A sorting domain-containing protein [Hymenobacter elongatus]